MRTKKYIGILLCMLTFVIACDNESLEDTYKEYAGKGEIRYLGKCNNLLVTPGWKRIIITWDRHLLFDENAVFRRGQKGRVIAGRASCPAEPFLVGLPPHPVGEPLHGGNVVVHVIRSN